MRNLEKLGTALLFMAGCEGHEFQRASPAETSPDDPEIQYIQIDSRQRCRAILKHIEQILPIGHYLKQENHFAASQLTAITSSELLGSARILCSDLELPQTDIDRLREEILKVMPEL